MSLSSFIYPASPKNIDPRLTDPSGEFRREVVKVLWSIVSFILIYILLVVVAVVLAGLLSYAGIMLIMAIPKLITLAIGVGLMGVGIMVLYFLFKFVFSSNKVDRSNLIEITKADQPLLFEFLAKVATETQTPLPKRVYLSADVNAAVFYDSGFWSMFLPIKKNLLIGLGLVNSINTSEFKAIIAHEFGHFSQRSMKLGSYVYNVNKVIYNMLYDNDDYKDTLQTWANFSNYFTLFAQITGGIVSGIQYLLKQQYTGINERYMALSRQMEFHADSVAASVSGSKPLVTSLRRFDAADNCYHRVLGCYDRWLKNHNRKALNIYQDHTTVMLHFGEEHKLPLEHGLIQVSNRLFDSFHQSRVIIKDQWASHPSVDEREKHLNLLNIEAELVPASAWHLFSNPERLQQQLTEHIYQGVNFSTQPEVVAPTAFKTLFIEEGEKYSFDKGYKGFYDDRVIKAFELTTPSETLPANTLEDLLTPEILRLPMRIRGMQGEIETLKFICMETSDIQTFEFNNEKFTKEEANALLMKIHKEHDEANASLLEADRNVFLLYHKIASQRGNSSQAADSYHKLFNSHQSIDEKISDVEWILKEVGQLYQRGVTTDMAYAVSKNMTRKEAPVKAQIREVLHDTNHPANFGAEDKEILERYLSKDWIYYSEPNLDSDAINVFVQALNVYGAFLSTRTFELKKQTLARQMEVISVNG